MSDNADGLDVPTFLCRELTPEIEARLKRLTSRHQQRRIKNPPKKITRAMRERLPGMIFGARIGRT